MRDKARGEEKSLKNFVLGIEKTEPLQSLVGYHFNEKREFLKVTYSFFLSAFLIPFFLYSGL
jgi:hypothetical protein